MTSALRWAAMRAILMFDNCEGQSHKTVSTDHNFWSERRAEADSNRGPSAYQPNALPLGQTGSHKTLSKNRWDKLSKTDNILCCGGVGLLHEDVILCLDKSGTILSPWSLRLPHHRRIKISYNRTFSSSCTHHFVFCVSFTLQPRSLGSRTAVEIV